MRLLSIDFGTSNTVAAVTVDGQAPRAITFDSSPLLPSAVFLAADGTVAVGREAQRQARLDPTRFEPNPKRRIDDGEVLLGDRIVEVVDLIAAVLRTVATEVRRQLGGGLPDEVRLTHPAQWGATRQNTLTSAARKAGLGNKLVLIPEPVAAAAQFTRLPGRVLPPGRAVAIYDLGGGTFDIAVVGRTASDFPVLAEGGLDDLGGLDFDQVVLDYVGRTASSADPGRWQQILRPVDGPSRRAARVLSEDVRVAKETLSQYAQTDVALPDPFHDVHLTRTEFEGLIRPNLMRSIEVLRSTLRDAGTTPDQLAGIFLVGGSSRLPLVAKLITEQLGVTPVALDQPETAVALGALLAPARRETGRTGVLGDSSSHPQSGGTVLGPRSGGTTPAPDAAGPPPNATRRDSSGPPPPRSAPQPVSGPPQQRSPQPAWQQGPPSGATVRGPSRAWMWVAAAVAAILVVGTVIFVMVNRSGEDTAGGNGNGNGTTQATISGGVIPSGMTTSAPVTAESGTPADTASADTSSADTASQDVSSPDGTAESNIPGAKVAVGDCIAIDDASQTDLNEQRAECSDPQAVYQITVIGGANADCDSNEATWIGKDGPLFGKKLCLLPNLAEGECIRTGDKAANGDYEKIDCAEATKDDTKIVLADQNSADTGQCPAGSEPYDFPKRDKLFCFGPAS